jgi:hypothetical protein
MFALHSLSHTAMKEWKSFVESRFGFYAEDLPRFVVYSVRTASYYEHPTGQPFTCVIDYPL